MKVLYLAPPARLAEAIAAHSFITEEIDALAQAGVTAYTLTDETSREFRIGQVRVIGMPSPRSYDAMARGLGFATRFPRAAFSRVWKADSPVDALRNVFVESA